MSVSLMETVIPSSFFFLQPLVVVNLLTSAKWRDLVARTCHNTNVRGLIQLLHA